MKVLAADPADLHARSPAELLRAARRLRKLQAAGERAAPPWLLPILFVPGIGGTRLELATARSDSTHEATATDLWDPDDAALQARLFDSITTEPNADAAARASLELAQRWMAPARVMPTHPPESRVPLMQALLGLDQASSAVTGLHEHLSARYEHLKARGWAALARSYWPLAERLQVSGDGEFVTSSHAHGWDWRGTAVSAAPALAERVAALLGPEGARSADGMRGGAGRWPAQRALVIVAENSGVDLVRAAWPSLREGSVLAVYAIDDVSASPVRGSAAWFAWLCNAKATPMPDGELLSYGWREWRQRLRAQRGTRLALNAVLPGPLSLLPAAPASRWLRPGAVMGAATEAMPWLRSPVCWDEAAQAPSAEGSPRDNPPADAAWQAAAEAAMRASQAGVPASHRLPIIDCRTGQASHATQLISRREALAKGGGHLSAWRFDAVPDRSAEALEPNSLVCQTPAQLCSAITRDITQRLLREPATPFGQAFTPLAQRLFSESTT
ncbi:hypothetical protein BH11PSE9_BH11PSE9_03540 [soil metagenome]